MIAYVTVGSNDLDRSRLFYRAILPALGYDLREGPEGLSFALPVLPGQRPVLPDFYVKPPYDGHPATAGNGAMVAFEAGRSQRSAACMPTPSPRAAPMRVSPAFARAMARISTSVTCAIPMATSWRCSHAIRPNRDAMPDGATCCARLHQRDALVARGCAPGPLQVIPSS